MQYDWPRFWNITQELCEELFTPLCHMICTYKIPINAKTNFASTFGLQKKVVASEKSYGPFRKKWHH